MKNKKMTFVWSITLLILCVSTLVIAVTRIVGIDLPDIMIRVLGIVELIALPIFVFTSIKKYLKRCNGDAENNMG